MNKRGIVIFSGYNDRSIISFLRTISNKDIKYGIISCLGKDIIEDTIYKENIYYKRKVKEIDKNEILKSLEIVKNKLGVEEIIILPTTESLNRFLIENIKDFNNKNYIIPLVDKDLYNKISNKLDFSILCNKYKIETPLTIEKENIVNFGFPIVAKPKNYNGINGGSLYPIIINNTSEYNDFLKNYNEDEFFIQEFVKGKSIYLLYYVDKNKKIIKFSQENLIQQENGKSILLAKSSNFHNTFSSRKYEKMLKKIGFRGLIMIEVRKFGERCVMIEANPRMWGPFQLLLNSGKNLFNYFLKDYNLIKKIKKEKIKNSLYFWDDGISKNIDSRNNLAYFNYSKEKFKKNYNIIKKYEIFNNKDILINKNNKNG